MKSNVRTPLQVNHNIHNEVNTELFSELHLVQQITAATFADFQHSLGYASKLIINHSSFRLPLSLAVPRHICKSANPWIGPRPRLEGIATPYFVRKSLFSIIQLSTYASDVPKLTSRHVLSSCDDSLPTWITVLRFLWGLPYPVILVFVHSWRSYQLPQPQSLFLCRKKFWSLNMRLVNTKLTFKKHLSNSILLLIPS